MANTFYPVKSGEAIVEGPSKFDLMNSLFKKMKRFSFQLKMRKVRFLFHF